jgi:hypothetical protein
MLSRDLTNTAVGLLRLWKAGAPLEKDGLLAVAMALAEFGVRAEAMERTTVQIIGVDEGVETPPAPPPAPSAEIIPLARPS